MLYNKEKGWKVKGCNDTNSLYYQTFTYIIFFQNLEKSIKAFDKAEPGTSWLVVVI